MHTGKKQVGNAFIGEGNTYIPVCEMDLSSAKKRHSTLGEQGSVTPDLGERANVQATTAEEQANF